MLGQTLLEPGGRLGNLQLQGPPLALTRVSHRNEIPDSHQSEITSKSINYMNV